MLDYASLEAMAAVLSEGSFDKAAEKLHVTPSAISQRIRQLEERIGTVLIIRAQPCRPTDAGRRLWQHVDEVALLEGGLAGHLPEGLAPNLVSSRLTIRIAANADSLATWLMPALAAFHAKTGHLVDLAVDDQEATADWLRSGEVMAAITAENRPVQGCRLQDLGLLRYRATASPDFMARHFSEGVTLAALKQAPAIIYNRKDNLQSRWVAETIGGEALALSGHYIPSSQAFVDAALSGMGWGMNPDMMVADHLKSGRLVELVADHPLDIALYWQSTRRSHLLLDQLTADIMVAARAHLLAPIPRQAAIGKMPE